MAEGAGFTGGKPMYGTKLWATEAGAWATPICGVRTVVCLGCGRVVQYTEDLERFHAYTQEHFEYFWW